MRKLRCTAGALALSLSLSFGGSASAQEADEKVGADVTPGSPVSVFGSQGQLAISSEAGATFERTSLSGVDGSTTRFVLRPGVDYFVVRGVSVGAFVGIDRQSAPSGSTTTFALGPRAGYDFAFSDYFSLWPKLGFSYNKTTVKIDGGGGIPDSETSNDAIALNLFAPFLFHTHRFFAGVGPALDTDLSGDAKATTFAIRVTLGGWVF